jgi:AcrR family transcriptional regulator
MERILAESTALFARRSPALVTVAGLSREIGVSAHTIKRLYCDIEHLLGVILRNHLAALTAELKNIPANTPNRPAHCRAAYFHFIRGPDGAFTPEHVILTRYCRYLPTDEREPTEAMRAELAAHLGAGRLGTKAAGFLDSGVFSLNDIQQTMAGLAEMADKREAAGNPPRQKAEPEQVPPRPQIRSDAATLHAVRPPGTVLH